MTKKGLLSALASRTIAYINDNIREGVDYEGKSYEYSKNPFWRPYDESVVKAFGKANEGKLFEITRSKAHEGKLGMIILGGYDAYKKEVYPESYKDFLTQTGAMLRNLQMISSNENGLNGGLSCTLGFTDPKQAQKAAWLDEIGVGKSKRLWRFLGISNRQKQSLAKYAGDRIEEMGLIGEMINAVIGANETKI